MRVLVVGMLAAAACSSGSGSSPPALVDIGQGLRGPAGLAATVYASGLTNVAAIAFDGTGRLWAATAAYSDKGQDGVYVVTNAGAAPTKVIDSIHTPLGLLWLHDTLYVASKEEVETYTGFDGTAFAQHQPVVALPSGVGEVNGLVLAPDGRIQLGISAPCDHCRTTIAESAAIVSFTADGSGLRVDVKGVRAPIDLAYFPNTNDLFVTMNQRDDLGDKTPADWLSLVQTGQSWGFPDCYGQGGTACNRVPAPVAELDKHGAVSGLAIVTGQLGATVGTAAIVAEWQTGKVAQVALTKTGSTYAGKASTFLTGVKNPEPLVLASDGALFVGDWTTGTIYRIART
jgi:glucose/arabinose dehydrogenase